MIYDSSLSTKGGHQNPPSPPHQLRDSGLADASPALKGRHIKAQGQRVPSAALGTHPTTPGALKGREKPPAVPPPPPHNSPSQFLANNRLSIHFREPPFPETCRKPRSIITCHAARNQKENTPQLDPHLPQPAVRTVRDTVPLHLKGAYAASQTPLQEFDNQRESVGQHFDTLAREESAWLTRLDQLGARAMMAENSPDPGAKTPNPNTAAYQLGRMTVQILVTLGILIGIVVFIIKRSASDPRTRAIRASQGQQPPNDDPY